MELWEIEKLNLTIFRVMLFKAWGYPHSKDYDLKGAVKKIQEMYKFCLLYEVF